jgi:PAS domain S-box-containing protein
MLAKKGEIVHLPDINYNVDNVFPVLPNKPVWIRAILFPLLNTAGIPERFVFMHEDITERKLVEEKLNESEIRFRTLSENELVGVYILKQGKLFYVNPELASIFGYKVNELIGASPLVVIHADDHALVTKNIRRRVEGEVEKLQYEFHGLCKNGEIKNIEVRGSHVKINNESVIIGNIMDITQRKLAEAELRRSEEQFRSTLDNMLEGCQIIGFDWKYIYINNTADIHNRRPKEELLGRKYMDIWPGIEDTEVFRNINICLVDRIQQQMENEFIYPDGAIGWFDISIQPVPEGVFILSIDITERKKTEKALKENEALFSTIFKSILIPVSLSDLATEKWVEVNDAFLKVTGYSRSETIGKSFRDINLWKNIEDRLHMRKMLLEKGRVTDYEVEINKKNGTTGIMLISVEIVELAGKSYLLIMGNEITERKKVEQAMKESEEKFRMSFMTGLDAFYIATLEEGRMIDANLNFENVFGYTREEAIGKTSLELNLFYDPDDRRKMISELKLKGFVRDMELMGRKKSGELITISISINQMMLENQPHIIGVIRDITERKKTESELMHYKNYLEHLVEERTDTLKQEIIVRKKVEQALTESENKYRNLVEYSTSIVLEWDTEGNILFMNKYGLEFFGYEKEEILGKKVLETIVEPVDSNGNNLSRKIQIIQKHPDDYNSSENENVRKNGEKVWIAWSNKGIYDTSGKLLKTLSVGIDRSKQREMEKLLIKSTEDLSEAEELYYTTVNSLDSWVFVIDDQQKILFINARLKKFLYQNGFDLEVIGMDMRKALGFLNEELFVQFDKVFKECTDTEREDEFEISGIKYFTLSKLSPILMNKKVFRIVTTIHDHTKIKQVEVEIMKNLERERDLNSLKTQFISTVSHEFRTPLAGILSSAQLLKIYSDTWDEEKKEKIFKQIFDSVKHTIALLDDASIINKGENNITIRPVLVNLNELLLDIVNENMQVYGNDIEILTSFILPKSKYKFDRDIIRHIFGNILSNALKYSGQSKKVIFNVTDENEQILFNIIDYGIGIPVDDQKFLFEPFHRASNVEAIRGTGFGLSIVKKLVDMLNGKIEIISEVGKGTNITIKLPYNTLQ